MTKNSMCAFIFLILLRRKQLACLNYFKEPVILFYQRFPWNAFASGVLKACLRSWGEKLVFLHFQVKNLPDINNFQF